MTRWTDFVDFAQQFRDSASHWRKDWHGEWRGIDGTSGTPPEVWATAIHVVGHDMERGLLSGVVELREASWHIFASPDRLLMIEVHVMRDGEESGFISTDEPTPSDCTEDEAIYWTADLVQGDLTGYHHIVWPDIGGRLFEPAMLDGKPHWAHRAGTDPRVFAVGRLSAALRADS